MCQLVNEIKPYFAVASVTAKKFSSIGHRDAENDAEDGAADAVGGVKKSDVDDELPLVVECRFCAKRFGEADFDVHPCYVAYKDKATIL